MSERLFGELRSLLQEPPSEALWVRLWAHLEQWPHEALRAQGVPYAAAHLARWPDEIERAVPDGKDRDLVFVRPTPLLHVTKRLAIHAPDAYHEHLRYTLDHPDLQHLDHLKLTVDALSVKGVQTWSGGALVKTIPQLELSVSGFGKAMSAFLGSKLLTRLTALELRHIDRSSIDVLEQLIKAAPSERLVGLRIKGHTLDAMALGALLIAPLFGGLERLEIDVTRAKGDVCARLAAARQLCALRTLRLKGLHKPIDGLAALFAAPSIRGLERLELRYAGLDAAAVAALAAATHMTALTELSLGADTLELGALLAAPHMAGLATLDLSCEEGGPGAGAVVEALEAARHMAGLATLDLSGRALGASGAAALARSAHLGSLRALRLEGCGIDAAGAAALVAAAHLGGVESLSLAGNPLGDAGAAALASSAYKLKLRRLDLSSCGLSADGLIALARSPHLVTLRHINLADNTTGRPAIEALARSVHLRGCDLTFTDPIDRHEVMRLRDLYIKYPEI